MPNSAAEHDPLTVLVADDDKISCMMLARAIKSWGYKVISVGDGAAAWEIINSDTAPHIAILDWMMPELTGLEVLQRLREIAEPQHYIYSLLLTGRNELEDVIEGLDAGADNYLVKPLNPQELRVRLNAAKRIIVLESELKAAKEKLQILATRDPLTGLWNRRAILDQLNEEDERARRDKAPYTVVMTDIDHFKQVNDVHGHPAGDAVITAVANALKGARRKYDQVGRYGGEEFITMLPGCRNEHAAIVADRQRRAVENVRVELPNGVILNVTASFGIATCSGVVAISAEHLIAGADKALYKAKKGGRNRVELCSNKELTDLVSANVQRRASGEMEAIPESHNTPELDT